MINAENITKVANRMKRDERAYADYLLNNGGEIVNRGRYYTNGPIVITVLGANGERVSYIDGGLS